MPRLYNIKTSNDNKFWKRQKLIIHFQFHQITQQKWGIIDTNPLDHFPNGASRDRIYGYFGVLGCLKHLKSVNIKLLVRVIF